MENELVDLLKRYPDRVRAVLNFLVESPYYYRDDNEVLFLFLHRHRREFNQFFEEFYGWSLVMDTKCARLYKEKWYNEAITPGNRPRFTFTKRDECIGFMLLLEFFEHKLEEASMTVDDRENLRFRFGEFLQYCHKRFCQLFEDRLKDYSEESIRARILRPMIPKLIQYRFLKEHPRPPDMELGQDEIIFEALPALYHYNATRLSSCIIDEIKEEAPKEQNNDEYDQQDYVLV